jgi:nitrogen fixation protein NifU and related proteins
VQENAVTYDAKPEFIDDHGELFFNRNARTRSSRYNPRLQGRMKHPSGHGRAAVICGRSIEIYLRIQESYIEDATFFTSDDCPSSRRCASAVAQIAIGLDLDKAALIGGDTILMLLKGLPRGKIFCAFLAAEAFHAAIDDWMDKVSRRQTHQAQYSTLFA